MVQRTSFIAGNDKAAFTASTADLRLPNGPLAVEELLIHEDCANTSATATTVAAVLDQINPIKVTVGSKKVSEIRGSDLYALNVLWLGNNPQTVVATAATSAVTRIDGLVLPVQSSAGAMVTTLATYAAVTNGGTNRISLACKMLEKGFPTHYEILTTSYAATATGAFLQAYDKFMEGDCIGFLVFSTTVPTATADTISANKIRIALNGAQIIDTNWELQSGDAREGYVPLYASPTDISVLCKYAWIDLQDDPPHKGDRVTIQINAGDTNAIRIIEVDRVPNA